MKNHEFNIIPVADGTSMEVYAAFPQLSSACYKGGLGAYTELS